MFPILPYLLRDRVAANFGDNDLLLIAFENAVELLVRVKPGSFARVWRA